MQGLRAISSRSWLHRAEWIQNDSVGG